MKLHLILESPGEAATPIKMANAIIELVNNDNAIRFDPYYPNALQEINEHLNVYNKYAAMNNLNSIGFCEEQQINCE